MGISKQNKYSKNVDSDQDISQPNVSKHVELTEEQRLQRAFETGKLFEEKAGLIKTRAEREKQKKEEIVELQSGLRFTVGEIERIISLDPQPYDPLYSYEYSYFKELYRVYYPDRDYKEYPKPFYVGKLFNELIYDSRFDKTILPKLNILNPLITGKRKRKHFQHFNPEGRKECEQYRDQTTDVLKESPEGQPYEFRKKLYEKYKVPYQLDFFKEQKKS
ncbi:hypothetical protein GCM10027299_42070 [Larkinella ripae]